MKRPNFSMILFSFAYGWLAIAAVANEVQPQQLPAYFRNHCLDCHGADSDNGLNLLELTTNLQDQHTFQSWVRIHDRIKAGEMPPPSAPQPTALEAKEIQDRLSKSLRAVDLKRQQTEGRVQGRRLTRTEYEHLLNDLLGIQGELANFIPSGSGGGFDVVASRQGISPQHIQGYFDAADRAIDLAIRLDPRDETSMEVRHVDYKEHPDIRKHIDHPDGQVVIGETDDSIVMFTDAAYLFKFPNFQPPCHGVYRMRARAKAFQAKKPVVFTLNYGDYKRGMVEIIKAVDLDPEEWQTVEAEFTLDAGQYLFPGVLNLSIQEDGKGIWNVGPAKYSGEGVALQWIEVEGPIDQTWPPQSTTQLLGEIQTQKRPHQHWDPQRQRHFQYTIVAGENPRAQIESLVTRIATQAFRRPLHSDETEQFVELGMAAYQKATENSMGHLTHASPPMDRAVRTTLRAILTAPQVLFLTSQPGPLDDFSLAARLAMFLWKSIPDDQLFQLAQQGKLSQPAVMAQQIDRMLSDPRSRRMVVDFANQWLRLSEIEATAPDKQLYPEYDNLLKSAMLEETYLFLGHLIEKNLSSDLLVDSPFTFLNRRLAEHYEIPNVAGQEMRLVTLPQGSVRGGLLAQASIHKVTANGTTTSPVRRGNWVLTNMLGQPPQPPPPNAGSVEPDTRGAATIRELLDKHRNTEACASCHKAIDPPGFALECFDVIGGFQERYRSVGRGDPVPNSKKHLGRSIWEYKLGPTVDATGITAQGQSFSNLQQFKKILLQQREMIAQNLIQQLLVYATGEEIQFADRESVQAIIPQCRDENFGLRTIIHEVISSQLFMNN